MKTEALSVVAPAVASDKRFPPDSLIWHLTLDQIASGTGIIENRVYAPATKAGSSTFIFDARNVLYSKLRPYLNKVLCPDSAGVATTELVPLRPNPEKLYREYLCYYLRSPAFVSWVSSQVAGAKMPRVKMKSFWKHKIPLPPLDDQIRIAHLLSKVEGLIVQRKQNLQQLDDLLKSVFLEMFGDPVRNQKEWDKPELKRFGSISTGNTPPRKDASNYSTRHLEWIKTDNIKTDSVYITQSLEYLSESGAKRGRTVTSGAILVACIAGSVESIGRAALTNRTVAFNQQINAIQPNRDVNPFYLYTLFKISKAYIQSHATKGMKKILTKGDFVKITMIKPPMDLQNQFATIAEKVEGIKSYYQQSLTELESLYGALSQKAFNGELDLSCIPLDREQPEIQEEKHEDATIPFDGGLPEHLKGTLANLNAFNQGVSSLKAIQEVARIAKLDLPQLDSVRQAVEQLAALRTPLQELTEMTEISQAMEQAQAAIKSLGLGHVKSISESVELARSMAANLPKIDFGLLNQHREAMRKATEPFESMRRVMESISTPSKELQESLRLQSETAKRLNGSIPDFTGWKKQAVAPDAVDFDDEEETAKHLFTREDVTTIFAYTVEPLGFDSLLYVLGELETVDFPGYETIKAILFELLAKQQLVQFFDEEQKTLLLRAAP